ncbi:nucleotidyl transferase AbiEii/AbiGii toxin family protein, partial [Schwartzia sp. (in: firmicutes)]
MSRLQDWLVKIEEQGYRGANARARLCQDIVLEAISKGKLSRHVTIKGGVVMRSLTGDIRRATQDMDIDFIRYSLADEAIRKFVKDINVFEDIRIEIVGTIEPLKHQDYQGKCINIRIYDNDGMTIDSKIDLGVHKDLTIQQEEYCFDVCMDDDGASLLINSKEQMLTEKLRSLLKFGPLSTRFKDVFDICYLVDHVNYQALNSCIIHYIFD